MEMKNSFAEELSLLNNFIKKFESDFKKFKESIQIKRVPAVDLSPLVQIDENIKVLKSISQAIPSRQFFLTVVMELNQIAGCLDYLVINSGSDNPELKNIVSDLSFELQVILNRFENLTSDSSKNFRILTAKIQELEAEIYRLEGDRNKFEIDLAESKKSLDLARKDWTLKISELGEFNSAFVSDKWQRLADSFSTDFSEYKSDLESIKNDMLQKQIELNRQLQESASRLMATEHGASATAEAQLADKFRNASVGSVVAMILIVGWLLGTHNDGESLVYLFSKITFVLLMLIPAGYLAKESARHRSAAEYRQQISLNLIAVGGYLSEMTPEQRTQIKMEIAGKLFNPYSYGDMGKPLDTFVDVLKAIFDKKSS
ncbi:hypothetical protein [Comamonas sp.]|uniref:hypothetical protein n=1 Tax=Comamonas sp. TaxID=34028 RepID=UPI00289A4B42|nr:hypothetical protein [Comamonas sp.]